MIIVTIIGVVKINHSGGCICPADFKNKIELFQKLLPWPINNSLNNIPAEIAPIPYTVVGKSITIGDSLLLNFPWKVLKINLHEYIAVSKAVKIPTNAAINPKLSPFI